MELYRIVTSDYLMHYGRNDMRWGVRRYQNLDGTLTEEGKRRLREKREAERLKDPLKYASMDDTARARYDANLNKAYDENDAGIRNKMVNEWVKGDIEKAQKVTDAGQKMIDAAKKYEQNTRPEPPPKKRLDLTNMTDQELRETIQREQLERQYNELFNKQPPARISKGRQFARTAIEVGGATLATASTVLGIALAIQQLKGNSG